VKRLLSPEVCEHGDAAAQKAIRDKIEEAGAAAGRALWQRVPNRNTLGRTADFGLEWDCAAGMGRP
jgi:hypothetical protein